MCVLHNNSIHGASYNSNNTIIGRCYRGSVVVVPGEREVQYVRNFLVVRRYRSFLQVVSAGRDVGDRHVAISSRSQFGNFVAILVHRDRGARFITVDLELRACQPRCTVVFDLPELDIKALCVVGEGDIIFAVRGDLASDRHAGQIVLYRCRFNRLIGRFTLDNLLLDLRQLVSAVLGLGDGIDGSGRHVNNTHCITVCDLYRG